MRNFLFFIFVSYSFLGQNDKITQLSLLKLDPSGTHPVHSILLHIEDTENGHVYSKAFGRSSDGSRAIYPNDSFRIASATKLFVAVIILQLAEEGKLDLDEIFLKYLPPTGTEQLRSLHINKGTNLTHNITVEQLLSHRSGLADIFTDAEEAFVEYLFRDPQRQHTPDSILANYFDLQLHTKPHFAPGEGWHYSDMNYVLLGLLIEQFEQRSLPEVIRSRILAPLNMQATYFEFYEPPIKPATRVEQFVGNINFSRINTSFDWAGGGLVATNGDLAIFIKALFEGSLLSEASLQAMMDVRQTKENESPYGLGIYQTSYNGEHYYGHYGYYGTYIGYAPATGMILSYCITQTDLPFSAYEYIGTVLSGFH
ncbi:serine hydrolase domain-containing protein [Altibacter lentus]|uniref:serine hydrolase domain-containing protein n=1 Tax=Altibacter lentus TaxID=1223410 RepID=UPI00054FBEFE|nr:serine hydrolase domain-containing protein [Altibacter lentus]